MAGRYSMREYLRFKIKFLKKRLVAEPMGHRTRKWTETELARLQGELKKLNAEIMEIKVAKIQASARALIQAK